MRPSVITPPIVLRYSATIVRAPLLADAIAAGAPPVPAPATNTSHSATTGSSDAGTYPVPLALRSGPSSPFSASHTLSAAEEGFFTPVFACLTHVRSFAAAITSAANSIAFVAASWNVGDTGGTNTYWTFDTTVSGSASNSVSDASRTVGTNVRSRAFCSSAAKLRADPSFAESSMRQR